MKNITTDMIHTWIDQCDSQLKLLQNAKDFIHREYYQKDSITYSVEEDLQDYFGNLIREHKTKKQMLEQMLIHCETENIVELFPYVFEDRIVDRLPEYLRKEFYNQVYEI
jgi:Fe-S cluster assembly scaffold protein SufB